MKECKQKRKTNKIVLLSARLLSAIAITLVKLKVNGHFAQDNHLKMIFLFIFSLSCFLENSEANCCQWFLHAWKLPCGSGVAGNHEDGASERVTPWSLRYLAERIKAMNNIKKLFYVGEARTC